MIDLPEPSFSSDTGRFDVNYPGDRSASALERIADALEQIAAHLAPTVVNKHAEPEPGVFAIGDTVVDRSFGEMGRVAAVQENEIKVYWDHAPKTGVHLLTWWPAADFEHVKP